MEKYHQAFVRIDIVRMTQLKPKIFFFLVKKTWVLLGRNSQQIMVVTLLLLMCNIFIIINGGVVKFYKAEFVGHESIDYTPHLRTITQQMKDNEQQYVKTDKLEATNRGIAEIWESNTDYKKVSEFVRNYLIAFKSDGPFEYENHQIFTRKLETQKMIDYMNAFAEYAQHAGMGVHSQQFYYDIIHAMSDYEIPSELDQFFLGYAKNKVNVLRFIIAPVSIMDKGGQSHTKTLTIESGRDDRFKNEKRPILGFNELEANYILPAADNWWKTAKPGNGPNRNLWMVYDFDYQNEKESAFKIIHDDNVFHDDIKLVEQYIVHAVLFPIKDTATVFKSGIKDFNKLLKMQKSKWKEEEDVYKQKQEKVEAVKQIESVRFAKMMKTRIAMAEVGNRLKVEREKRERKQKSKSKKIEDLAKEELIDHYDGYYHQYHDSIHPYQRLLRLEKAFGKKDQNNWFN